VVHKSSPLGEMKRSALLRECIIGSDAAVPAASLPSLKIWRELDRKSSISVILFLKSHAVPGMTDERVSRIARLSNLFGLTRPCAGIGVPRLERPLPPHAPASRFLPVVLWTHETQHKPP
jgi:hypothetical protein